MSDPSGLRASSVASTPEAARYGSGAEPVEGVPLLRVEDLQVEFPVRGGLVARAAGSVKAVDRVSFTLHKGETLGLVGESGCGKSTVARTLVGLAEPGAGEVYYRGVAVSSMDRASRGRLRREIAIVLQDPFASLNPRMTVEQLVSEPWSIHSSLVPRSARRSEARRLLDQVGLGADYLRRYPHQLSGGQRQRVGIARALALQPEIMICDEAVSALDVSVQAQIINLLQKIQDDLGLAYVFISHDLSVVRHISDRVEVMYAGQIVEAGDKSDIFERATHPYTQALLSAVPSAQGASKRIVLAGEIPSLSNLPQGCNFASRCWKAAERCRIEDPELIDRFDHGHVSRCHFASERAETG